MYIFWVKAGDISDIGFCLFIPSFQTQCNLLFILQNYSCCQTISPTWHVPHLSSSWHFHFYFHLNDISFLTITLNIFIIFVLSSHEGVINILKHLKTKHLYTKLKNIKMS